MAERKKTTKRVVRVEPTTSRGGSGGSDASEPASGWKPTPEAKSKALTYRIIAIVLWVLAIGGEAFEIFWVLRQSPPNMWILIGGLVVIAGLAIGGSLLWKQANRLDPASRQDSVRFFIQNQLGAIITVVAFLPLIILIFLNKDMSGSQKGIAGGIAIALLLVAGFLGTSINPPSTEQYDAETNQVIEITGENLVFWTKSGKVFHLCEDASAVNLESADNTIYSGTVADAHAAGKDRLTLQVDQEIRQCGFEAPEDDPATVDSDVEEPALEETPAP
ncbi:flagellar basal body-associated protein FliL [Microbacteriaceae bacterium SG_E_30_P1]|uniref:Flagellar basal body-associated protein FliL n=1 Tax=Antiquaquibacter oligotrophicus TaxID=2880260 RepID=A0ABT6KQU5_9MICO|nr:hypothetical protein [Antiquaquibacter oligotrophicus]MDH6182355.1 flagellar basal body-associated protein FliL [Antiquaquibacter oligotrophicus]UDF11992.1 hypothetical protein LH407_07375 [Antiquaquibacter oligotrophicus]